MSASITNVGDATNTIGAVTIKAGEKTVYADDAANNNYTVTRTQGTLSVTAKALDDTTGITVSDPTEKPYDGTQQKPSVTVTHQQNTPITLTEDTDYTIAYGTNVAAGSGSVTVTGKGNYTGSVTKQFPISKRPLTITANSANKMHDGTALTANGYAIKAGSLASGDVIKSVTVTGSRTDAGTSANKPSAAVIEVGSDSRTESYAITYTDGTLEVTKAPQAAPINLAGQNETIETKGDGSISGIESGMEYRKKGGTDYTAVTAQMVTDDAIPGLASGVYEVRYAQTTNYFESPPIEITIGFEAAARYELTLTAPTFTELTEGYAQPQAEPLTITSTGNAAATIASVTSSDPAFEITGSGSTVPADGTLTDYGVLPATGLATGSYKAEITVTYNNGATATAEVAVEVKPNPNPVSPPSGGAGGSGNTSDSQPPAGTEQSDGQILGNMAPSAGQPQIVPDAKDTVEQASFVPVNQTPDGINNAALEDKKVVVQETLPFGSGSIHVTVDCIETEQRRVEAALVSSQQVVNACLSEQEKQSVVNGDSIEIRLTVKLCKPKCPKWMPN